MKTTGNNQQMAAPPPPRESAEQQNSVKNIWPGPLRWGRLVCSILALTFAMPGIITGQIKHCGNDSLISWYLASDSNAKAKLDASNRMVRMYIDSVKTGINQNFWPKPHAKSAPCAPTPYVIPVVFFEMAGNNMPSQTVTYSQVKSALAALNFYYQSSNIQFCFAVNRPDQTPIVFPAGEPGLIRIPTSSLSNLNYSWTYAFTNEVLSLTNLVAPNNPQSLPNENYLKIFIVDQIDPANDVFGVGGIPGTIANLDFVIMDVEAFGNKSNSSIPDLCTNCTSNPIAGFDQGKILAHEVGHFLNLYHIFEQTTCIAGSSQNPFLDGDAVADTDPVEGSPNPVWPNCTLASVNCNTWSNPNYDDGNYMQWGNSEYCLSQFSPMQNERMINCLDMLRPKLTSPSNLFNVGVSCNEIATPRFLISGDNLCLGTALTVTASIPAGANVIWIWGDGTPNATAVSASHIYANTGIYKLKYWVYLNGTLISCYDQDIFVANCGTSNCTQSNWYFGHYGELHFTANGAISGTTALANTTINVEEAAAALSDGNCNLFFYSDGMKVWDANHQLLNPLDQNGNPILLNGNTSTAQTFIVADPANVDDYYIFTNPIGGSYPPDFLSANGLFYTKVHLINGSAQPLSIVDMNIPVQLPTGITTVGEGITAIPDCKGGGFWLITYTYGYCNTCPLTPAGLIVHHITSNGISSPTLHNLNNMGGFGYAGIIKASPDGKRLAINNVGFGGVTVGNYGYSMLLDFDATLGIPTNPVLLPHAQRPYGVSFSPNSSILYVNEGPGPSSVYSV